MTVVVWIVEGTWEGCVDAALDRAGPDERVVLLHVRPAEIAAAASGAWSGLLGRGHPQRDPGQQLDRLGEQAETQLLEAAELRLGRPARWVRRTGRVEREVVAAAAGADLLVVGRDGDRSRLGPRSLGPSTRFAVDHAPCPVLLVWPEPAPDVESIPPPPPHPPGHHPPRPHHHEPPP
jgi:nucleotide-binding universal stress UspA family protein